MCTSNKEITSCQSNSDIILRKAREYYEKIKRKEKNIMKKNREKRREYRRNRYHNMTIEEKRKINKRI